MTHSSTIPSPCHNAIVPPQCHHNHLTKKYPSKNANRQPIDSSHVNSREWNCLITPLKHRKKTLISPSWPLFPLDPNPNTHTETCTKGNSCTKFMARCIYIFIFAWREVVRLKGTAASFSLTPLPALPVTHYLPTQWCSCEAVCCTCYISNTVIVAIVITLLLLLPLFTFLLFRY